MWNETTDGRVLIADVSREVVVQVAPDEADLFDPLLSEYFNNPVPPTPTTSEEDAPLGFGLEGALVLVTPAVAAAVTTVLSYIAQEVLNTVKDESAAVVTKRIREIFKPKKQGPPVVQLSKEELEQVKMLAQRKAEEFGMAADDAARMSEALIGTLVLA